MIFCIHSILRRPLLWERTRFVVVVIVIRDLDLEISIIELVVEFLEFCHINDILADIDSTI